MITPEVITTGPTICVVFHRRPQREQLLQSCFRGIPVYSDRPMAHQMLRDRLGPHLDYILTSFDEALTPIEAIQLYVEADEEFFKGDPDQPIRIHVRVIPKNMHSMLGEFTLTGFDWGDLETP